MEISALIRNHPRPEERVIIGPYKPSFLDTPSSSDAASDKSEQNSKNIDVEEEHVRIKRKTEDSKLKDEINDDDDKEDDEDNSRQAERRRKRNRRRQLMRNEKVTKSCAVYFSTQFFISERMDFKKVNH